MSQHLHILSALDRKSSGAKLLNSFFRPLEGSMTGENKLGKRIKAFRRAKEISLEKLASDTGLSLDFLHGLEDNKVYPSIGPMQKIACALGIRLGTFLDDDVTQDPVISALDGTTPDVHIQNCRNKNVSYGYVSLGKGKSDRNMEPFHITIAPLSAEEQAKEQKTSSHQGEEFMLVLKGKLKVVYGRETYILEEGQSIYYNSIVPHYVGAYGQEAAQILAVTYHP